MWLPPARGRVAGRGARERVGEECCAEQLRKRLMLIPSEGRYGSAGLGPADRIRHAERGRPVTRQNSTPTAKKARNDMTDAGEVATLAGGCFWCLEAVFDDLKGVDSVESGYMGGRNGEPQLRGGLSGKPAMPRYPAHLRPKQVSFRKSSGVLRDPRSDTLNRQGTMSARSIVRRSSTRPCSR